MLTIIFCFVFNIQTVMEDKNDGMEFDRSTQLVFSLKKREASSYDSTLYPSYVNGTKDLADIDIESEIMSRLDLAGVRNANVSIVNGKENHGYELRVSLAPYSDVELNNIIDIISRTGYLSVGTIDDQTIMTQDNSGFFAEEVASLVYSGTTPYPTINIGEDTDFQSMKSAAEEAANNAGETTTDETTDETTEGEEATDSSSTKLFIWFNKTLNDTYEKAYGTNDTIVDEDVLKKVIATINVDDYDAESRTIAITSDIDGNAFTISTARAMVNLLNAPDYGFDITYLYQNTIAPTFGTGSINIVYIVLGAVFVIVALVLILAYGLAGVTSALSLLSSLFVSLILASALGFEFSIASIVALFALGALSVMISTNYFEHVKNELKKGREIEKSNQEGYHKSFFLSLDISVIFFAVSLFSFLLASGSYQVFFGVTMIGSVVTFLLTNYLNRFLTYFLIKNNREKLPYFALLKLKKKNDDVSVSINESSNPKSKKKFKWVAIAFPVVAALLTAIALPVNSFLNDSLFNNTNSYSTDYTLNISFKTNREAYDALDTTDAFLLYIETIGKEGDDGERFTAISSEDVTSNLPDYSFVYYPDTAFVNSIEKTDEDGVKYYINYYSLSVDRDLSILTLENPDANALNVIITALRDEEFTINLDPSTSYSEVLVAPGRDPEYVYDSLDVGCYFTTPTNIVHQTNNFFLILFLISVFAAVYSLIRYGLNLALTTLATGTVSALLFVGLMSALHIPFNSFTSFGILFVLLILIISLIPPLYTNHILIKENDSRYSATDDMKIAIVDESFNRLFKVIIIPVIVALLFSISLFFVNAQLLGLGLVSLINLLLVIPLVVYLGVVCYYYLYKHISFKKWHDKYLAYKEAKGEKSKPSNDGIVYVDPDSPHETIVPGLNDFLR